VGQSDDFVQTLSLYRDQLWPVIDSYLDTAVSFPDFCRLDPQYQDITSFHRQLIRDYPERKGKYLRPTLLLLAAQSMGIDLDSCLLPAAAMQLSEDWILVHDDVEDDSLERRGQPTLHRLCSKELAVNAGDCLQTIMWRILFDHLQKNPTTGSQIIDEFSLLLNRTTLGQTIDIKWNQDQILDLSDEDIFLILESKTCYYTIAGPLRLGAILAKASDSQLRLLYKFGLYLGRTFQIVDDLLDLTSDFSGLKKQQYNDIYEGKRTIMLAHLWRQSSTSDKKLISQIMTKTRDQKTPDDIAKIIELMNTYGSLDYGRQLAQEFGQKSLEIFDTQLTFLSQEPYRSQIRAGINFIINRQH